MVKKLVLWLFLMTAAFRVGAVDQFVDYTDIYYIPAEAGWGVNVVQSDNFLFVTFFIYGPDNKPTWYTANLTLDASGNYNGTLFATAGTFYAMPWRTSDLTRTAVGTASFQPTSAYTARLVYIVTTPAALAATVTKLIQRQPLTAITIGGTYSGVASIIESACANAGTFLDDVDITITQPSDVAAPVTIVLDYIPNGPTCTYAGNLTPWGKLYQVASATYTCTNGFRTTARIDQLIATPHGIEGVWSAITPAGCNESGTFQGLLQ